MLHRPPGKKAAEIKMKEELAAAYTALTDTKLQQIMDMAEHAEHNPDWKKAAAILHKQPQTPTRPNN